MSFIEKLLEVFLPWKSKKWVMWKAKLDLTTCAECRELHGKIYPTESVGSMVVWPAHLHCRCQLDGMDVIPAGRATEDGEEECWSAWHGSRGTFHTKRSDEPKDALRHEHRPRIAEPLRCAFQYDERIHHEYESVV